MDSLRADEVELDERAGPEVEDEDGRRRRVEDDARRSLELLRGLDETQEAPVAVEDLE